MKYPKTSILNSEFRYSPSAQTDVGKTIRKEQKRIAAEKLRTQQAPADATVRQLVRSIARVKP